MKMKIERKDIDKIQIEDIKFGNDHGCYSGLADFETDIDELTQGDDITIKISGTCAYYDHSHNGDLEWAFKGTLAMSEDGIEISAKSSQVGSAVEKIDIFKYVGQNLKVSFNSEFVIAAVKALGSADVTFAFVGEMKPFIVENASDDSVVQIVTPVRTY